MTTIIQGDCLTELAKLPACSVHCCVTSPPYWGLRDYGVDGQLGLEKTPEEYVAKMVAVFQEVRRVLRDDGTLWCNLGDSYASGGRGGGMDGPNGDKQRSNDGALLGPKTPPPGLKPKDLCGIPWRVAFALQADGWYLRQDIVWHKPNPMPESVTDRCTKSHEYIFLLSKSARYFYDAEAVKEPADVSTQRDSPVNASESIGNTGGNKRTDFEKNRHTVSTRNKRSVWTIPSAAFSEAHFATFPPDLIKPCILAGTSARGCCPKCGAPWERMVEKVSGYEGARRNDNLSKVGTSRGTGWKSSQQLAELPSPITIGWQPTCECGLDETVPCTVLDPFGGSGTTGMVSTELGRRSILIELNPDYAKMAERRTFVTPGLPLA